MLTLGVGVRGGMPKAHGMAVNCVRSDEATDPQGWGEKDRFGCSRPRSPT